jgi:DNA-binding response OmpR family regulator
MLGGSAAALVAEDDDQMAEVLRFILERKGYTVQIAPDGRTAQRLIDTAPAPAIVLLDIMLPHVDGYDLLARLRASESWRAVPVIIVSARSQEQDIVRGFEAGADDYITKPFKPDELRARIHRLVKK